MPLFDQCVPMSLLNVQKWFSTIITSPLEDLELILPVSPSGNSIKEEAATYILPGPVLEPHKRIEIYNQQYWWRLLKVLQDAFPCVLRLFGYADFNHLIGIPYLEKYKSDDWSLNTLGSHLPKWVKECYNAPDKELVHYAAEIDLMYQEIFFKPEHKGLSANEDISVKPLYMQPFARLMQFPYDIPDFRKNLLKQEPEYWLENAFPELKKNPTFILLFRSPKGGIKNKVISETEWLILSQFHEGTTVDALCEWIERQSETLRSEAETHLQKWFGEWTIMGIFAVE
jgi:hypothetical protein